MGSIPMKYPQALLNQKSISCLLVLTAITAPTNIALAQDTIFIPTPPDQGAPTGRRQGGATRGDCLAYQDLTALIPQVEGVVWSQTASAAPRFFFYIPQALNSAVPLEFVIQDSDDNYAFYEEFAVEAEAGILAVAVAPDAELAIDESYSWTFSVYCDAERPSASVSVSGTVQRVAEAIAPISTESTSEAQLEQLRQYAAAGIWHEAIALAFDLHKADPSSVEFLETLEALLEQSGLTDIAPTAPVLACCQVE